MQAITHKNTILPHWMETIAQHQAKDRVNCVALYVFEAALHFFLNRFSSTYIARFKELRVKQLWGQERDLTKEKNYYIAQALQEKLPQVNKLDPQGKIYMGSYPGDKSEAIAKIKLEAIVKDLKVKTFISLIADEEVKTFSSYKETAEGFADDLTFHRFGIPDMGTAGDDELFTFIKNRLLPIAQKAKSTSDSALYIHCFGGHGRTGTVSAVLIGILYDLRADQALEHVHRVHAMRKNNWDPKTKAPYPAPQTDEQRAQVRRLLARFKNI